LSNDSDHLVQQYPAWREAVKRVISEKYTAGDVLDFAWLYDAFLIDRPTPETPLADAQKAELRFLGHFKDFEEALLTEHQIALSNVRGVGYRIVAAGEQTGWAEDQGTQEVKKALRKLRDRLTNVDLLQLNAEQRKQNADALARLAMMAGMTKSFAEKKSVLTLSE
jgi:hypothetical protein